MHAATPSSAPRRPRRRGARVVGGGLALTVALTAAGCSGASSTKETARRPATPTPSLIELADGGAGLVLAGTGYELTLPGSWRDATATVAADYPVDAAARDVDVAGGLPDNVNVTTFKRAGLRGQARAQRLMRRQLSTVARSVVVQPPTELDGETAYHVTARSDVGRSRMRLSQFMARHQGRWVVLTFAYGRQTDAETQAEEIAQAIDTFAWTTEG